MKLVPKALACGRVSLSRRGSGEDNDVGRKTHIGLRKGPVLTDGTEECWCQQNVEAKLRDHPKLGAPANWFSEFDHSREEFWEDWTATSVANIRCEGELTNQALKLTKPLVASEEHWSRVDWAPDPKEMEKLRSLYLSCLAFEHARNDILSSEVYGKGPWRWRVWQYSLLARSVIKSLFWTLVAATCVYVWVSGPLAFFFR